MRLIEEEPVPFAYDPASWQEFPENASRFRHFCPPGENNPCILRLHEGWVMWSAGRSLAVTPLAVAILLQGTPGEATTYFERKQGERGDEA